MGGALPVQTHCPAHLVQQALKSALLRGQLLSACLHRRPSRNGCVPAPNMLPACQQEAAQRARAQQANVETRAANETLQGFRRLEAEREREAQAEIEGEP